MRDIRKIIIHCSASKSGNRDILTAWHKKRGFCDIRYHFILLNGFTTSSQIYQPKTDGLIQAGRHLNQAGAHCRGHNIDSIGICLIGARLFSAKQLFEALPRLLLDLFDRYSLGINDIYGHYEFTDKKTCPNISMDMLRSSINKLI